MYANAYPNATSSAIITLKPAAKRIVPTLECLPWNGREEAQPKTAHGASRGCFLYANAYPNATSSAIITLKPTAKRIVPTLECLPWDISGISSSTTT